jgi:hypothetical protein
MALEACFRAGRWVQNPNTGKCRINHIIRPLRPDESLPELEILKRGVIDLH